MSGQDYIRYYSAKSQLFKMSYSDRMDFDGKLAYYEKRLKRIIAQIALELDVELAYENLLNYYVAMGDMLWYEGKTEEMVTLCEKGLTVCNDIMSLFPEENSYYYRKELLCYRLGDAFFVQDDLSKAAKYMNDFLSIRLDESINDGRMDQAYDVSRAAYVMYNYYSVIDESPIEAKKYLKLFIEWEVYAFINKNNAEAFKRLTDNFLVVAGMFENQNDAAAINQILFEITQKINLYRTETEDVPLQLAYIYFMSKYARFIYENNYSELEDYVEKALDSSIELTGNLGEEYGEIMSETFSALYFEAVYSYINKNGINYSFMNKVFESMERSSNLWADYQNKQSIYEMYLNLIDVFIQQVINDPEFSKDNQIKTQGNVTYNYVNPLKYLHTKYINLSAKIKSMS